ncbi:uncharacterized protein LOC143234619 isoform X2 [Tachypleus tridentatus]|uniref:uncharacterized protein LOC143234619 isoform X2 n=1 Tax=Tachypleus tridentatus TaxID=6853 RepID=UPI003FD257AF
MHKISATYKFPKPEMKSRTPIDVNIYATRKTLAQGMMDIALLTANASQLKLVLSQPDIHEYFHITVVLISASIVLQFPFPDWTFFSPFQQFPFPDWTFFSPFQQPLFLCVHFSLPIKRGKGANVRLSISSNVSQKLSVCSLHKPHFE